MLMHMSHDYVRDTCIYCSYYISDWYIAVTIVLPEANGRRYECAGNPAEFFDSDYK